MKLISVHANQPEFNTVTFTAGFNVILAERTKESTKKDSRNGLGKTTLIEIIHFCLGSNPKPNRGLRSKELEDWIFTLKFELQGNIVEVSRSTSAFGYVVLHPDTNWGEWPIKPTFGKNDSTEARMKVADWNLLLGHLVFDLEHIESRKYVPTFRALLNYKARRYQFDKPFENAPRQNTWDQRVHNAILLDLNWEFAREWQLLKLRKDEVDNLKRASRSRDSVLARIVGTVSELENEQVRLERRISDTKSELDSFKVHSQYTNIQKEANDLTEAIHQLTNNILHNQRLVEYYETSIDDEKAVSTINIEEIYEQAGISLPNMVVRRLEEVKTFHEQVVENRQEYLRSEIQRLQELIEKEENQRSNLSDQRARLMSILSEYGALEEYTALQEAYTQLAAQLTEIESRIARLKLVQVEDSQIKIERQQLKLDALADFEERNKVKDARRVFNDNSESLYEAPGNLLIDIKDSGYSFDVDIKRSGSDGVDKMKVFCYDLMIAEIWAGSSSHPQFLIHDSTIFADVDERQIAMALRLAKEKSESLNFQYIVTLNSDKVPWDELKPYFDLNDYVCLALTDHNVEGSLLGIRF